MLSRQEGRMMHHLASVQNWDRSAGGNTGRLFLMFGGPVCADLISNCPLDRVLTYENLIYLLNVQFYPTGLSEYCFHPWCPDGRSGGHSGGGKSLSGLYLRNRKV